MSKYVQRLIKRVLKYLFPMIRSLRTKYFFSELSFINCQEIIPNSLEIMIKMTWPSEANDKKVKLQMETKLQEKQQKINKLISQLQSKQLYIQELYGTVRDLENQCIHLQNSYLKLKNSQRPVSSFATTSLITTIPRAQSHPQHRGPLHQKENVLQATAQPFFTEQGKNQEKKVKKTFSKAKNDSVKKRGKSASGKFRK